MKLIILAGGKLDEAFAAQTGLEWRCDLKFQDESFLDIGIRCLRPFGEVVVVGGPRRDDVEWHEGGERFFDSFSRGVAAGGMGTFLMASADLPFLTSEAVSDFIEICQKDPAAIHYPIVNLETMGPRFGGMKRTSLRLREGEFTGGNLFFVDGAVMRKVMPRMEAAYQARKNVLKLGGLLGMPTLLAIIAAKVVPGSVSIRRLEQLVGESLGAPVRAIVSTFPEIAADIDSSEHFAWLQSL